MYARAGDRLIVEGDSAWTALIVAVPHDDGPPPYVVKWLTDGHIAILSPAQFARIIPASHPAGVACHYQDCPDLSMDTATPVSSSSRSALPEKRESVRTHHQRQRDDLAELTRVLASSQYPALPHHVQARIERDLAAEAADRRLVSSRRGQPACSDPGEDNRTSGRRTAATEGS